MYDTLKKPEKKVKATAKKPNRTGLPDRLKNNIEGLSGYNMDDVRVYRNSPRPAQFQALAYTQGTEIHLAPGQERHLPHEAWHVVQQMQGRVRPTMRVRDAAVNDSQVLEREADHMGEKIAQMKAVECGGLQRRAVDNACIQQAKEYTNNHILHIDPAGKITNQGTEREDHSVATLANILFDGGFKGGHLLKREYGGLDNLRNVVPWSDASEAGYTEFEAEYVNYLGERYKGRDCTFSTTVGYCNIMNLNGRGLKKFVKELSAARVRNNYSKLSAAQSVGIMNALDHFPRRVLVSVGEKNYAKQNFTSFGFDVLTEKSVKEKMVDLEDAKINNIADSARIE